MRFRSIAILAVAGPMSVAGAQGTAHPTCTAAAQQVQDACQQAVDMFHLMMPQLGFAIIGGNPISVLFRLLVAIALRWGLNPNDLKLITAVFVFVALVLPNFLDKLKRKRTAALARQAQAQPAAEVARA